MSAALLAIEPAPTAASPDAAAALLERVSVRIINAAHRTDRREECRRELEAIGWPAERCTFFAARMIPAFGARGCALSHAMALAQFLFDDERPFALVFEDDFQVREPDTLAERLAPVLDRAALWDVVLLAHNQAVPVAGAAAPLLRVINAQTASAYLVGRDYAATLVRSFFRSAELLRQTPALPAPNRALAQHTYCCDQLWKSLQTEDRFWAPFPAWSVQRASWSDIENKVVDYGV